MEQKLDQKTGESALVKIRKTLKVENFTQITNEIPHHNEVSLHCIDNLNIENKITGEISKFLIFGGAAGFLVMKAITCFDFDSYFE